MISRADCSTTDQGAAGRIGFLVCCVGPARLALPLAAVIGVTEAAPVTPLPFVPAPVDGLVLAMGRAVVQVTLATIMGIAVGDAGVLVVTGVEDDVRALKVSSVLAMVEIDADAIGPCDSHGSQLQMLGVFAWNGSEVEVLDVKSLWLADFLPTAQGNRAQTTFLALAERVPERETTPSVAQDAFLLIEAGGERYALRSEEIFEIIVVDHVRPMPGAPIWLAGLLEHRNMPTLAIDMRRLLGHDQQCPGQLALLVAGGGLGALALLIDRALGILYVENRHIHPILERTEGVESYFVNQGRIVGIIGASPLLGQVSDALTGLMPRTHACTQHKAAGPSPILTDQVLTVRVGESRFAIALDRVDRILAGVAIAALPGDGNGFSGLADIGEAPVPVIDLRLRLERTEALHPRPPCAIVRLDGAAAGLVVDQVLRIENVTSDDIEPVDRIDSMPISGVFIIDQSIISLLIIDRLLPIGN